MSALAAPTQGGGVGREADGSQASVGGWASGAGVVMYVLAAAAMIAGVVLLLAFVVYEVWRAWRAETLRRAKRKHPSGRP